MQYNVGDKFIFDGVPDNGVTLGEKVEIIGFTSSDRRFYIRNKSNRVISCVIDYLKPIPKAMAVGDEVWVKMEFAKQCSDGNLELAYTDCEGDYCTASIGKTHDILIKNDQGEFVSYGK